MSAFDVRLDAWRACGARRLPGLPFFGRKTAVFHASHASIARPLVAHAACHARIERSLDVGHARIDIRASRAFPTWRTRASTHGAADPLSSQERAVAGATLLRGATCATCAGSRGARATVTDRRAPNAPAREARARPLRDRRAPRAPARETRAGAPTRATCRCSRVPRGKCAREAREHVSMRTWLM